MDKEFLKTIEPLLKTNPMFGVFSLGDGSCWFCSACGERSEKVVAQDMVAIMTMKNAIPHKPGCGFIAHGRAIEALKRAVTEAGVAQ